jgi:predicted DCC family thiol-disulfide oxidoreductase YuxK
MLASLPSDLAGSDTVVLYRAGRVYVRSAAALRAGLYLRWWWRALALAGLAVPLPLRDAVYRAVAKRRHKWFDPPDICAL